MLEQPMIMLPLILIKWNNVKPLGKIKMNVLNQTNEKNKYKKNIRGTIGK
jgi:hypothetical protein